MSSVQPASYGCFERCEPNRRRLPFLVVLRYSPGCSPQTAACVALQSSGDKQLHGVILILRNLKRLHSPVGVDPVFAPITGCLVSLTNIKRRGLCSDSAWLLTSHGLGRPLCDLQGPRTQMVVGTEDVLTRLCSPPPSWAVQVKDRRHKRF